MGNMMMMMMAPRLLPLASTTIWLQDQQGSGLHHIDCRRHIELPGVVCCGSPSTSTLTEQLAHHHCSQQHRWHRHNMHIAAPLHQLCCSSAITAPSLCLHARAETLANNQQLQPHVALRKHRDHATASSLLSNNCTYKRPKLT
ncbi:hypothetical protein COO60DRAFT_1518388 [Scenedesmus sp. NREL 46B-D3]|nr:hypothetical protein COO60DRAFT_1518388 [Scenedesmus sp. NREL 46B-D3]